ncbi:MAG: hypothetical protein NVS4B3_16680 [Gemmatimonadaceae bacterium]
MKPFLFLFGVFAAVGRFAAAQEIGVPPTDSAPRTAPSPPSLRALPAGAQLYEARSGETYAYTHPAFLQSVRNVPRDLARAPRLAFRRDQLSRIGLVLASTAALVAYDQQILDGARRLGRQMHLGTSTELTTIARFNLPGGTNVPIAGPANFPSFLYFLGDGWTAIITAGGFLGYGTIARDNRALRTASEIAESLMGLGVATQTMKHISGRQSPSEATVPGGAWRPLPSLKEYGRDVPAYDAFPSGHLASAMAAVTVIALNYPEKPFVKPIGYSVIGVVAYQMVNNRVHWAGDYPLALAVGGLFARLAVDGGRTRVEGEGAAMPAPARGWRRLTSATVAPTLIGGRAGLGARYTWDFD